MPRPRMAPARWRHAHAQLGFDGEPVQKVPAERDRVDGCVHCVDPATPEMRMCSHTIEDVTQPHLRYGCEATPKMMMIQPLLK